MFCNFTTSKKCTLEHMYCNFNINVLWKCITNNHNENFEKYAYEIVDVVNAVLGMVS